MTVFHKKTADIIAIMLIYFSSSDWFRYAFGPKLKKCVKMTVVIDKSRDLSVEYGTTFF